MPVSLPTAEFMRNLSDEPQRLPRTVGLRQLQGWQRRRSSQTQTERW